MNQPFHSELKKEFQLERMILFSDAVFAIAITILVIEIKVPDINPFTATENQLGSALFHLIPKFIGFLISFFIIGLYWTIHHRMFGYVINYTPRLLWLNLLFLFAVVTMPFSTAFYSEFIVHFLKTPVIVYASNVVFLGVMNFVLWRYITNRKRNLVEGITAQAKKYFTFRSIMVPVIFIIMAFVYILGNPKFGVWVPMVIPILMAVSRRLFLKSK